MVEDPVSLELTRSDREYLVKVTSVLEKYDPEVLFVLLAITLKTD